MRRPGLCAAQMRIDLILTDLHSQCMLPTCEPKQCCTQTRCRVLQEKAHNKQIRGLCCLCNFCNPVLGFVS